LKIQSAPDVDGADEKWAVTLVDAAIVTVHVPLVSVQASLQPSKLLPDAGEAVSVTSVPVMNEPAQVEVQAIPCGLLVTVPEPESVILSEE